MKSEIETLVMQKREIEARIRMLRNQTTIVENMKVDVEHYPTSKPDRHFLAIYYRPLGDGRPKWQTVFSANSRGEVIEAIPNIIENLQHLYENLTREDKK